MLQKSTYKLVGINERYQTKTLIFKKVDSNFTICCGVTEIKAIANVISKEDFRCVKALQNKG